MSILHISKRKIYNDLNVRVNVRSGNFRKYHQSVDYNILHFLADLCVTWLLRYSWLRDRVHHFSRHCDSFAHPITSTTSHVKVKARYLPLVRCGCSLFALHHQDMIIRNYFTFFDRSDRSRYFCDIIITRHL